MRRVSASPRTMAKPPTARSHSRVPVSCFLYYLGEGLVGTGKVCDLSVKGWRIDGDKPVTVGMKLTLRVFLPDQPKAIDIEGVMVQWVKERTFGLEIVSMNATAEARIHEFVESMLKASDSSHVA
ncbi:MAG: PilZ domain-containing protein [Nitrospira defluvii]|nr:PilZ domain-containing protein [Nitrospira defluvii]